MNLNTLTATFPLAARIFKRKLVLLIIVVLFGSWTNSPAYLKTPSNAPLAIGRIKIEGKMIFELDKLVLKFKNKQKEYTVRPDENGFFSINLPIGENHISLIQYSNHGFTFYRNLPKNYIVTELSASKTVYYVGDIIVHWSPTRQQLKASKDGTNRVFIGGVTGGFIGAFEEAISYSKDESMHINKVPDFMVMKSNNTLSFFKDRFPSKNIVTQLLKVNNAVAE